MKFKSSVKKADCTYYPNILTFMKTPTSSKEVLYGQSILP